MNYSLQQFEQELTGMKPRIFDTYILPAFLIFYAIKSKSPMGKKVRRMLFVSGVYMTYRNYQNYKQAVLAAQQQIAAMIPDNQTSTS